ncbi:hypothetical protein Fmac_004922 [Flemingia macrophylla]|uniref:Uncharacterized protein n=1 Tax=Flemingia macrophylla TaxID=520843 RepID=A0ABD1N7A3_9FABA
MEHPSEAHSRDSGGKNRSEPRRGSIKGNVTGGKPHESPPITKPIEKQPPPPPPPSKNSDSLVSRIKCRP